MATGTVKFFDVTKGFGFIGQEHGGDVYVHVSSLAGTGFRYLAPGETVEFEILSGNDGKPKAANVRPVSGRVRGTVKKFDHRKGFGFIVPKDGHDSDVFFHFSGLLGDGVRSAEQFDEVEFEVVEGERGPQAVKIKRLDPRPPLFRFASLRSSWAEELEDLAEDEDWTGRSASTDDGSPKFPILRSYLIYTFARLADEQRLFDEKKIAIGSERNRRFACFNTGLVTELQEEIFAVFEEAHPDAPSQWILIGFYPRSDRFLLSKFDRLPPLANYFDDPSVLLYDRRRELTMDIPHIVQDNLARFPASCQGNEYLARQLLESARALTQQRVYRNYKTAIPQFHRGEVQLLLPLCLERPGEADLALVVSRVGEQYRGDTVLTLEMAYNNARLLTRPDTEWLIP